MVDQQEYGATKDSNGLNPFVPSQDVRYVILLKIEDTSY